MSETDFCDDLGINPDGWQPPADEFVCGEGPDRSKMKPPAGSESILIPADIWQIMKQAEERGYPHQPKNRRFRNR